MCKDCGCQDDWDDGVYENEDLWYDETDHTDDDDDTDYSEDDDE